MYQNAALVEALARARIAELHQSAQAAALSRREHRQHRVFQSARTASGWRLVELGLRLAVPRGEMHDPLPRG